jgi:hypothetical protein
MDKDYIDQLIIRLRRAEMDENLRYETIQTLTRQRFLLEDIHVSAKQNGDRSAEHLSGIALGKPGYAVGDAGV